MTRSRSSASKSKSFFIATRKCSATSMRSESRMVRIGSCYLFYCVHWLFFHRRLSDASYFNSIHVVSLFCAVFISSSCTRRLQAEKEQWAVVKEQMIADKTAALVEIKKTKKSFFG